jgi:hypothetical protein
MAHRGGDGSWEKNGICGRQSSLQCGLDLVVFDGSNRDLFFFMVQTASSVPEEEEDEQSSLE